MNAINWATAGQIAVVVVIAATIIAAFLAYRAAKADEPYRATRYVK